VALWTWSDARANGQFDDRVREFVERFERRLPDHEVPAVRRPRLSFSGGAARSIRG
jgi:hypothetical protein